MTELLKNSQNSKKTESFHFTLETQKTFKELKLVFVQEPLLHHYDFAKPVRLKTDVSLYAVEVMLS